MDDEEDLYEQIKKKEARKAKPGGSPKFANIPRNWLHQAVTYMDKGEMISRIVIEFAEIMLVMMIISGLVDNIYLNFIYSGLIVHTWNWVTNGLFWAVIIFTFPSLKNPGAEKSVKYLNNMKSRLLKSKSISGLTLYGSLTRNAWHDRSDIDLRVVRNKGAINLLKAVYITMRERFIGFLYMQPMDMYLADSTEFLKKLRSDEIPVILIKKGDDLEKMYPGNAEQDMGMHHFSSAKT